MLLFITFDEEHFYIIEHDEEYSKSSQNLSRCPRTCWGSHLRLNVLCVSIANPLSNSNRCNILSSIFPWPTELAASRGDILSCWTFCLCTHNYCSPSTNPPHKLHFILWSPFLWAVMRVEIILRNEKLVTTDPLAFKVEISRTILRKMSRVVIWPV